MVNMKLYRYSNYSTVGQERLRLDEFSIIKHTKCGVWIDVYGAKKFVNFSHQKKYAYTTKELAFTAFRYRKLRQLKILRGQMERAEEALRLTMEAAEPNYVPLFGMW